MSLRSEVGDGLHWIPACAPREVRSEMKQDKTEGYNRCKQIVLTCSNVLSVLTLKDQVLGSTSSTSTCRGGIQHPRTGRLVTDGSFVLFEGEMRDGVFQV